MLSLRITINSAKSNSFTDNFQENYRDYNQQHRVNYIILCFVHVNAYRHLFLIVTLAKKMFLYSFNEILFHKHIT